MQQCRFLTGGKFNLNSDRYEAANTRFIVGVTITTGNSFDLATGPLFGSPQPNYTFSNAFTGSSGLDTNNYSYSAGNGTFLVRYSPKMLAWPHLPI
jgi:hypothetical protein